MTNTQMPSRRSASSDDALRILRPLFLLLIVLLATACGSGELVNPHIPDADRATPGWVTLNLTTPRADDGAVQLSVNGPAMDSLQISRAGGFASLSSGIARVLITGPIASGAVARFWVPDTRKASIYVATVDQAAARGTYLLQDLSQGYSASVTR